MTGWRVVSDNFYVGATDERGAFRLPEVAPGTYPLRLWHVRLGERTRQVTVRTRRIPPSRSSWPYGREDGLRRSEGKGL